MTRVFLKVLFTTAILETQKRTKGESDEQALVNMFESATATPQVIPGLRLFLEDMGNDVEVAKSKQEKDMVRWGIRTAREVLNRLQQSEAAQG